MKSKINIFIQKNFNYITFNINKFYIYFLYEEYKVKIISKQYGEQK